MSGIRLALAHAPVLRVDLRGITPDTCEGLTPAQVERLPVTHGNQTLALAEFFTVTAQGADATLDFEGDLSRFDRLGWQLARGRIAVHGPVGDHAGACMTGGAIEIHGSARDLAACEMAGGTLSVDGDVGDFAASTLPGSMDGMRGGTFVVKGRAGERFGDRMRRGTALVHGDAGDFLASRMVAGTIGVGGAAGAHVGYGMRRGSVVFAGAAAHALRVAPTFVPAIAEAEVMWQLLARDLARHGGPFAGLASRRTVRHLGDVSAAGKGELICAA
jgi:formylmethanofuran dehydrogenase subunit C